MLRKIVNHRTIRFYNVEGLKNNHHKFGMFLDLQKAFDCVNLKMLFDKLVKNVIQNFNEHFVTVNTRYKNQTRFQNI